MIIVSHFVVGSWVGWVPCAVERGQEPEGPDDRGEIQARWQCPSSLK